MTAVNPMDNPEPIYRQARWRMAAFLAVASAVNYADRTTVATMMPALRTGLGLSDVELGMLGSGFLWAYALASPLAGNLADRWSRSKVVLWSLLIWSLITVLHGMAHAFSSLFALRITLGLAECLFLPAAFALIAQHHPLSTRAKAMSLISIGVNGGMVLGGTAAGYLAEHMGWRPAFWIVGSSGLFLALVARYFLPQETVAVAQRAKPMLGPALRYLLRLPTFHLLVFESVLTGMGMWIFFSWLPLYFRDRYGLSLAEAGFAGTFMLQACVLIGIVLGGWISDRAATRAPQRRLLAYGACYIVAAPSLLVFLISPRFGVVVAAISWFSLFRGIGQASEKPILCEIVPAHYRATALGLLNACATGAGGCGVLLAGLLKGMIGLQVVFAGISGLCILAGVILLLAYRLTAAADIRNAHDAEEAAPSPDGCRRVSMQDSSKESSP